MTIGSFVDCADNSNVRKCKIIGRVKGKKKVRLGDVVVVSVQSLQNQKMLNNSTGNLVKVGTVCAGLVVGLRGWHPRQGGTFVLTNGNRIVLLAKSKNRAPVGSRVGSVVPKELRSLGYARVVAIAVGVFL